MRLVSWNVQWCRGLDGVVDPARIAAELRRLADPDVACLQEIASDFPELPGSKSEDQPVALWREMPEYEPVVGWAVDVAGAGRARKRFGNMILSRLRVGRVLRHSLPWPAAPEVPHHAARSRRSYRECAVRPAASRDHASRVLLRDPSRGAGRAPAPSYTRNGARSARAWTRTGPFAAAPARAARSCAATSTSRPQDPLHRAILDIGFVDAWQALNPGAPHPPTFRVHERDEGESPYCCDFVFVTARPRAAARLDPHRRREPRLRSPAGHRRASMSRLSSSTRLRLTPKSRRPRREHERTWSTCPSK